jgi:hypothetical protein
MGVSVSKSPVLTSSVTIPKEVGIKENPAIVVKKKNQSSLANMIDKVNNKLTSLPDDTTSLKKMILDYSGKFENIKLPDMLVKNKSGVYDQTLKKQRVDIIVNLLTVVSNINLCYLKLFFSSEELNLFIKTPQKLTRGTTTIEMNVSDVLIKQRCTIITSLIELSIEQMISDAEETRLQAFQKKRFYELENDEIMRIIEKYSRLISEPMNEIIDDKLDRFYVHIMESDFIHQKKKYQPEALFVKEVPYFDNVEDWVATEKYGPLRSAKFFRKRSHNSRSYSRNRTRKN